MCIMRRNRYSRIIEIYGMSESCGPGCGTTPRHMKFGTIGKAMDHVEAKINEPGDDGVGEIWYGEELIIPVKSCATKTVTHATLTS